MIKITKETDIEAGNIIFNPAENVWYTVDAYDYDKDLRTEVAHLGQKVAFGASKKAFTITIEEMIKKGYKLENEG